MMRGRKRGRGEREGARTATSMRSLATVSRLRITFFSILTSWASFLARSGPKAPAAFRRKAWPDVADRLLALDHFVSAKDGVDSSHRTAQSGAGTDAEARWGLLGIFFYSPKPPRPKMRPDLVVDGGGGGFCLAWSASPSFLFLPISLLRQRRSPSLT